MEEQKVLYDLGCGEGGVARAAIALGWKVIGIDNQPQPNYPGEFVLADATKLTGLPVGDLAWASPDCQGYSRITALKPETAKPRLVPEFRESCKRLSSNYVIENVPGCYDLEVNLKLCGAMFELPIIRWRWFETTFFIPQLATPPKPRHFLQVCGKCKGSLKEWQDAMGLPGMSRRGLAQAVPFAYTWYILTWFNIWPKEVKHE